MLASYQHVCVSLQPQHGLGEVSEHQQEQHLTGRARRERQEEAEAVMVPGSKSVFLWVCDKWFFSPTLTFLSVLWESVGFYFGSQRLVGCLPPA